MVSEVAASPSRNSVKRRHKDSDQGWEVAKIATILKIRVDAWAKISAQEAQNDVSSTHRIYY